jgi:hypothetical protein
MILDSAGIALRIAVALLENMALFPDRGLIAHVFVSCLHPKEQKKYIPARKFLVRMFLIRNILVVKGKSGFSFFKPVWHKR